MNSNRECIILYDILHSLILIFIFNNYIPKYADYPLGILSDTQSVPQPNCEFGHCVNPPISLLAPLIKYALIFSPYKYGSLPSTIPHCIRSAAPPVTNGVAIEVPVLDSYPPPIPVFNF